MERVTGIEPAWSAWKASGTRSRLSVKIGADLRISVFDLDRCGPYWAPFYRPYGPAKDALCAFVAPGRCDRVDALSRVAGTARDLVVARRECAVSLPACSTVTWCPGAPGAKTLLDQRSRRLARGVVREHVRRLGVGVVFQFRGLQEGLGRDEPCRGERVFVGGAAEPVVLADSKAVGIGDGCGRHVSGEFGSGKRYRWCSLW